MADINTSADDQTPDEPASLESREDSLEATETTDATQSESDGTPNSPSPSSSPPPKPAEKKFLKRLGGKANIYPVLFGLVLLIAGIIILIAYLQSQQTPSADRLKTQNLDQKTLNKLANSDASVGSSQSILNVKSSAIFAGQVLARQNLEVAGNLQVGGTAAFSAITVAGTGQFSQATISKNLAVSGDAAIQGTATIAKSLQVNGNGTFSGPLSAPQVTTGNLQLSGDLILAHHITTRGVTPSRSGGSALGSGGSVSIGGSDTAGLITINTGGSPAAGCFATITFTSAYAATPYVMVTPVNSGAGGLSYYIKSSATNFSICDATAPPAGSSFGFNYFVIN